MLVQRRIKRGCFDQEITTRTFPTLSRWRDHGGWAYFLRLTSFYSTAIQVRDIRMETTILIIYLTLIFRLYVSVANDAGRQRTVVLHVIFNNTTRIRR